MRRRITAIGNVMFIGGRMGPSMNDLVDQFVTAVNGTHVAIRCGVRRSAEGGGPHRVWRDRTSELRHRERAAASVVR